MAKLVSDSYLQVNVVEGMKMYEELFDDSEVGKLVSLANDLRIAGRQGKFHGKSPTFWYLDEPKCVYILLSIRLRDILLHIKCF